VEIRFAVQSHSFCLYSNLTRAIPRCSVNSELGSKVENHEIIRCSVEVRSSPPPAPSEHLMPTGLPSPSPLSHSPLPLSPPIRASPGVWERGAQTTAPPRGSVGRAPSSRGSIPQKKKTYMHIYAFGGILKVKIFSKMLFLHEDSQKIVI
jgi:hypothetical protein